MKKVLKIIGVILLVLIVAAAGVYAWASVTTSRKLAHKYAIHSVDFPIPFPLDSVEVRRLRLKPEAARDSARARAVERGRHLVESRYGCRECHGENFGGGVMVDAAPVGRLLGSNITMGKGSRTLKYQAADWDHIVRHGVRPDSTPAVMPSVDFRRMTDQELSDIITYVRSHEPVDSTVPPIVVGPVLKVMIAAGKARVSADIIDHAASHGVIPPDPSEGIAFGRHMATTCTGCHREDFSGGPIVGGPPEWPPAANITPAGLTGWTFDQFKTLMREATRPDKTMVRPPMANMNQFARNMTDPELQALWQYLQSLQPVPTGK